MFCQAVGRHNAKFSGEAESAGIFCYVGSPAARAMVIDAADSPMLVGGNMH